MPVTTRTRTVCPPHAPSTVMPTAASIMSTPAICTVSCGASICAATAGTCKSVVMALLCLWHAIRQARHRRSPPHPPSSPIRHKAVPRSCSVRGCILVFLIVHLMFVNWPTKSNPFMASVTASTTPARHRTQHCNNLCAKATMVMANVSATATQSCNGQLRSVAPRSACGRTRYHRPATSQ